MPPRFDLFHTVSKEDPVAMVQAMESLDSQHWQKAVNSEHKFVYDNGT